MSPSIQFAICILACVSTAYSYHILFYQPLPSKSHDLLAKGIIEPLQKAGHQITWVTAYPAGKPKNITVVDVSQTIAVAEDARRDRIDSAGRRALNMTGKKVTGFGLAQTFAHNVTKAAFSEELKRVIIQNKFDAVITEWFFSDIEAGFAAVQRVPWILLSGILMHPHMESLVDTVRTIPIIPTHANNFPIPMSFFERIQNTYSHLLMTWHNWLSFNSEAARYEKYFKPIADAKGVPLPPYSEAIRNVSIMLVNSHPSFAPAQCLPPNVIDIGGYHINEDTPPLPKDLQQILDASPQGVVYFSMGSVMKSSALPEHTQKDLIKVLGSIPQTVLWKFEGKLENLPKNMHVRAWMPQASILAHPNVKVFISHGGLLSTLEALHFGIPMLAVPVFGDQPGNADRAVRTGYAVKVTFSYDMKEEFQKGLKEMLSNDRYYKKAKYISSLFRNRPVAPSALIKHYVELAIESKGAYHLRSKANFYEWYQLWMLDQIAALFGVFFVVYLVLKSIINLLTKPNSQNKKIQIQKDKKKK